MLDQWFEHDVKPRLRGRAFEVRYADDAVLVFEHEDDARRVLVRPMKEEHRPVAQDELEADIEQALWKARKLLPRKVEPGNFNPYKAAARAVAEHLERCGISCYRKPPLSLHGNPRGAGTAEVTENQADK